MIRRRLRYVEMLWIRLRKSMLDTRHHLFERDRSGSDAVDVTTVIIDPTNGTATLADGDTCFTYTPGPGYVGGDTLVITDV